MPPTPSLRFETFAAVLAANGYAPEQAKLQALYAALHTIEALQQRVRQATADMALEPAHVFVEPARAGDAT
ncbi:MAG: hypothetical protein KDC18_07315 [Alphaproteobacteria bacterium]|nr:hypothetical protein [Alphaproteobacteria bacterium]